MSVTYGHGGCAASSTSTTTHNAQRAGVRGRRNLRHPAPPPAPLPIPPHCLKFDTAFLCATDDTTDDDNHHHHHQHRRRRPTTDDDVHRCSKAKACGEVRRSILGGGKEERRGCRCRGGWRVVGKSFLLLEGK